MKGKFAVKKEIRTLGIDFCNPNRIVGAIARGGVFLDGLAIFPTSSRRNNREIASAIIKSKFFPELRLIMTHDPTSRLDTRIVERATGLSLIQVSETRKKRPKWLDLQKTRDSRLWVRSSLPPPTLREIISTTWTVGRLPEPLRIAHLVTGSRFFREKPPFPG
jgi:endonuclease V-like protein UPF0215 family